MSDYEGTHAPNRLPTYKGPGELVGDRFGIKDSGARTQFDSGMVRDVEDTKIDLTNLIHGPMLVRWATHLTKAKAKYPDITPGVPNWTLAAGDEELARFKRSAFRHFLAWLNGETDEDHAAGVFFNINGGEYVKDKMVKPMSFDEAATLALQGKITLAPNEMMSQAEINNALLERATWQQPNERGLGYDHP